MVVCDSELGVTMDATDGVGALAFPVGYTVVEGAEGPGGVKIGGLKVDGIADEGTELDAGAEPDENVP